MEEKERIATAVSYVNSNFIFSSDIVSYNKTDYWMDPRGVLYYGRGDSEDFAFMVHSLLLAGDVESGRLRTYFGYKNSDAYSWVAYKRRLDEEWVILDAPAGTVADIDTLDRAETATAYHSAYAYLTSEAYIVIPPGEYLNTYTTNGGNFSLPLFTVESYAGALGTSSLTPMTLVSTGVLGRVGIGVATLLPLYATATGLSGIVGSGIITWKTISVISTGYGVPVGLAAMSLPGLSVYCSGVQALFDDDYILRFQ